MDPNDRQLSVVLPSKSEIDDETYMEKAATDLGSSKIEWQPSDELRNRYKELSVAQRFEEAIESIGKAEELYYHYGSNVCPLMMCSTIEHCHPDYGKPLEDLWTEMNRFVPAIKALSASALQEKNLSQSETPLESEGVELSEGAWHLACDVWDQREWDGLRRRDVHTAKEVAFHLATASFLFNGDDRSEQSLYDHHNGYSSEVSHSKCQSRFRPLPRPATFGSAAFVDHLMDTTDLRAQASKLDPASQRQLSTLLDLAERAGTAVKDFAHRAAQRPEVPAAAADSERITEVMDDIQ